MFQAAWGAGGGAWWGTPARAGRATRMRTRRTRCPRLRRRPGRLRAPATRTASWVGGVQRVRTFTRDTVCPHVDKYRE